MASSRVLNYKYFNKLGVNRLEVNYLKVNEEKETSPKKPSWLFSLIGDALYIASTNTLTLLNIDNLKLLGFTNRPYRQQIQFDGVNHPSKPIQVLKELFSKMNNNADSFSADPPNAVLVMNNKQVVYELKNFHEQINTFKLKPLPDHSEYYNHTENYIGKISLFIDDYKADLISQFEINFTKWLKLMKDEDELYFRIDNIIKNESEEETLLRDIFDAQRTSSQTNKNLDKLLDDLRSDLPNVVSIVNKLINDKEEYVIVNKEVWKEYNEIIDKYSDSLYKIDTDLGVVL